MRKTELDMDSQSRSDDSELEETVPNSGFATKVSGGGYGALLIRCCSLKIITTIKENLEKKNLKAFEKSCFGHLLEMNPLCFQGPLLLHLLLNIDIAASNNGTLIFNINNSKMEFGPRHFQLITGLRFGTSEAAATAAASSRIQKHVFRGKPSIMLKDVEEAFLDALKHDREGRGEVTLKLALLYFLYGVVLPGSRSNKKIDVRYLHLADDLRVFCAFHWGRVGYEFLVSSVLSARRCLDGSRATRLYMPGFTFALQVWAYENMPSLATYCGAHARSFQRSTMRILNWSVTKVIRFDQLKQFFTPAGVGADHEVEDEEAVKEATPARQSRLSPNPIPTNKSQSSLTETERIKDIVALAFDDNPALHTPQPLWKTFDFEISEGEYERIKVLYKALLDRTKCFKLFISYAQFEAFAVIQGSQICDNIKCLQRGRAVFERGLSYFRSCAPNKKEERRMLLEAWFDTEYRFGEVGDVGSVRAMLPQKLKKRRRVQTEDGTPRYEEYIDYLFPEEKDVEV